mmetsp:Transcript_92606/g.299477  ORF Transcript_92606/g.299477 Transcript_92606/m.299477 type:complete len:355 (-) Transcript_92606:206-1270(-)
MAENVLRRRPPASASSCARLLSRGPRSSSRDHGGALTFARLKSIVACVERMDLVRLFSDDGPRTHLLTYLSCRELAVISLTSRSVRTELPDDAMACVVWAGDPRLWLAERMSKAGPSVRASHSVAATMDLCRDLSLPSVGLRRSLRIRSKWADSSIACHRPDATLCCWPLLRRLSLKPQHVHRLAQAPQMLEDLGPLLCLALDASVDRAPSEDWMRSMQFHGAGRWLNMDTLLLAALRSGGLLLVQHRIFSLDSCRGSPDSPAGLEFSAWVLVAPDWGSLTRYLRKEEAKNLRSSVQRRLGLHLEELAASSVGADDEASFPQFGQADSWTGIWPDKPVFDTLDDFARSVLVEQS